MANLENNDQANIVKINGYTLPGDVEISFDCSKDLVKSKIIDGGTLIERVSIDPIDLNLMFTIRQKNTAKREIGVLNNSITKSYNKYVVPTFEFYVFADKEFVKFFQQVWKIDDIVKIENSFLNSIGIKEVICEKMTTSTKRGSTDIYVTLKLTENIFTESTQTTTIS